VRAILAGERAVSIRFDDAVGDVSVFSLAGPDRIALDISGAEPGRLSLGEGPVRAVRQARRDADTARIVLELDRPMRVTDLRFADDGRSLRLAYRPADEAELGALQRLNRRQLEAPASFRAKPPSDHYSVSVPIGTPRSVKGLPPIAGPDDDKLPLVVLDSGHGGHDPGAISPHGGKREKDITLSIARKIRADLLKSGRVRVALTRDEDKFVALRDRYMLARQLGADLFISIHADAAGSEDASGATVYTLSEVASDREAQRLAVRENKADIINGVNLGSTSSDVSSILIDLTQRETMNVSASFAKLLLREAASSMRLRSDSHKFASFVVLKAPDTPSVLLESGYLTNEEDVRFLSSAEGQAQIARSVSAAVQAHFARRVATR
jgi:N-acetylmuramoyl-L-alanine amidase